MNDSDDDALLDLARGLAAAARAVSLRHFRQPFAVDAKSDASPVTIADRDAETAMRRLLAERVPAHGILGEEHGGERTGADHVWVLDPIDGTRAFITGVPVWGTLIALVRDGRPVIGIIDHPALGERWIGVAGRPTLHERDGGDAVPVRTRPCGGLATASLFATAPEMFADPADFAAFRRVADRARYTRYGTDCLAYGLIASGHADIAVEGGMKPYDFCSHVPVLEGAGGVISDWRGRPLGLASDGRVLAAGDAALHREAVAALAD
ncbi:MAG: histidinol-phosphatase [Alphaproteobacteria bacterium]